MKALANIPPIPPDVPVLIAGPTASGKSALALQIAREQGGVIVNADASQVYDCWRIVTARPSVEEEAQVAHHLYGHVGWQQPYSAGHWLRDVSPFLNRPERPIIVGGTGLYFSTLTRGMANIAPIPAEIRLGGDALSLEALLSDLDPLTIDAIDVANRARVQRAWEVQTATGRSILDWQADTPPPVLALSDCFPIVFDVARDWLLARIMRRFDVMLQQGALDEVAAMLDRFDPTLPAFRAIGVPEIAAHLRGEITLDQARDRAGIATRQFAKRQRTWFRSKMQDWHHVVPDEYG
ncbi:MAG: tRNA (adenosine(37)-N6)-dimethylallyltransferase MiaA [Rhodobacteraceae bacterium]|nr:tRNA (adenosine(37)-N6)-dimethylallyltransferase MiaA [Paracoccaceae bacterium]